MKINRVKKMLEQIRAYESITLVKLSRDLSLSMNTVRRYVSELEDQGLIRKVHGGVISTEWSSDGLMSFNQRMIEQRDAKIRIGQTAASLIEPGDILFLDAGSTVYYLAQAIDTSVDLTIVTNNLAVTTVLADAPSVRLIVLGGEYTRTTRCLVGTETLTAISRFKGNKFFFGATGLSATDDGVTNSPAIEADIKRAMVGASSEKILLADSSKFGVTSLVSFCTYRDIDTLITDVTPTGRLAETLRRNNVEVLVG